MSASKHTAGPWEVIKVGTTIAVMPDPIRGNRDSFLGIAEVYQFDGERPQAVTNANARLLAASPALASALERLVSVIDAAGLSNLANGVQLGQTSWFVKASDALSEAREALSALTHGEELKGEGDE